MDLRHSSSFVSKKITKIEKFASVPHTDQRRKIWKGPPFWAILDFISGTGSIGHLEYFQLLQIRDFIWHFSHDEYQHGK